ncbi:hypothetical protein BB560_001119 [Smittium megazygosporum]|uniref:PRELI/MSF1 domain-containing protein n=1 Tax=Smittium megazygosporum TaxID=133381 RepID=A0A2T9ZII0_9FUNG|nr:hypothetical protein BB560_001119 [Smittium megazygosporum]
MKFFETSYSFNSSWDATTLACWRKYPNDKTPHVKHVEILSRELDPTTGILKTERLIIVSQNVPRIITKMVGAQEQAYVLEYSEVDPSSKTLTLRSTNLTMKNFLAVTEHITYTPLESDPEKTIFKQNAVLSADGMMSRFATLIEDYSLKVFKANAIVGKLGFEQVLERILSEQRAQVPL